jgi:hypothetical protein
VALQDEFGDEVYIRALRDRGVTGNFEVTFVPTGQLIHSKTKLGHGRLEKQSEREAIFALIRAYKSSLETEATDEFVEDSKLPNESEDV